MSASQPDSRKNPDRSDIFGAPTRWTLIRRAAEREGGEDGPAVATEEAQQAWRELIDRYRDAWEASLRRWVRDHPEADDIVSDFSLYILKGSFLAQADPSRGRFRAFIQGVIRRYALAAMRTRRQTQELHEGIDPFSEERKDCDLADERDWARTVLRNALARFADSHVRDGEILVRYYGIDGQPPATLEVLMKTHGMSRDAVHQALSTSRRTLGRAIVNEARDLMDVNDPESAREEIQLIGQRLLEIAPLLDGLGLAELGGEDQ